MDPATTPDLASITTGFGVASVLAWVILIIVRENRKDLREHIERTREDYKALTLTVADALKENIRVSTEQKDASIRNTQAVENLAEKISNVILSNGTKRK